MGATGRYHKRRALAASIAEKLGHALIGWTEVMKETRHLRGSVSVDKSSCRECGAAVEIDRKNITGAAVTIRCPVANREDPMQAVNVFVERQSAILCLVDKKPRFYREILASMTGKPSMTLLEVEDLNPKKPGTQIKDVLRWAVSKRILTTERGLPTLYHLGVPILPVEEPPVLTETAIRAQHAMEKLAIKVEMCQGLASTPEEIYAAVFEALKLVASVDHEVIPAKEESLLDKSISALLQWTKLIEKRLK